MGVAERVAQMMKGENREILHLHGNEISEIRLRIGRPVRFDCINGLELSGDILDAVDFRSIIACLMDNSLYSREDELKQGYFTTSDGSRVGVCGKVNVGKRGIDDLSNIASACVRIPRDKCGCATEILECMLESGRYNVLIASPPGLGKTTLLRDLIRSLSEKGMNVGVADERRELAACQNGIPQLDTGCRTDVMDGLPKSVALGMMIRACSPDIVAADEIGTPEDADAIRDARRCGVFVAATVHGQSYSELMKRRYISDLLKEEIFDWLILLGPNRGQVQKILSLHERVDERKEDVQGSPVGDCFTGMYLHGKNAFECPQEKV